MSLKDKFDAYFKDTGVQKVWLARRTGLPRHTLYAAMRGLIPIPQSHWQAIVAQCRGFVTMDDLMNDHLQHLFQKYKYVRLSRAKDGTHWTLVPKQPQNKA